MSNVARSLRRRMNRDRTDPTTTSAKVVQTLAGADQCPGGDRHVSGHLAPFEDPSCDPNFAASDDSAPPWDPELDRAPEVEGMFGPDDDRRYDPYIDGLECGHSHPSVSPERTALAVASVAAAFAKRGVCVPPVTYIRCAWQILDASNGGTGAVLLKSVDGEWVTMPDSVAYSLVVEAKIRKQSLDRMVSKMLFSQRSAAKVQEVQLVLEDAGRQMDKLLAEPTKIDRNGKKDLLNLADRVVLEPLRRR